MVFKKGYKQTEEHKKKTIEAIKLQHKINPNYGMRGKSHSEKTKELMSLKSKGKPKSEIHKKNWNNSMKKLRGDGKLNAWNKGLTPRRGKYPKITYKSHKVWTSQKENLSYVPKGMVIHHIDLNPYNNDSSNLYLMKKSDHHKLHNAICKKMRELL